MDKRTWRQALFKRKYKRMLNRIGAFERKENRSRPFKEIDFYPMFNRFIDHISATRSSLKFLDVLAICERHEKRRFTPTHQGDASSSPTTPSR